jgi:hypothetical protein
LLGLAEAYMSRLCELDFVKDQTQALARTGRPGPGPRGGELVFSGDLCRAEPISTKQDACLYRVFNEAVCLSAGPSGAACGCGRCSRSSDSESGARARPRGPPARACRSGCGTAATACTGGPRGRRWIALPQRRAPLGQQAGRRRGRLAGVGGAARGAHTHTNPFVSDQRTKLDVSSDYQPTSTR